MHQPPRQTSSLRAPKMLPWSLGGVRAAERGMILYTLLFIGALGCEESPAPPLPEQPSMGDISRAGGGGPTGPAAELLKPPEERCAPEELLDPGPTLARRLTRIEYQNTIQDLFALEIPLTRLPPEEEALHFDNQSAILQVSPLLAEQWMRLAEEISEAAWAQREQLFSCVPDALPEVGSDAERCLTEGVQALLTRVWRRPPSERAVRSLVRLARNIATATIEEALEADEKSAAAGKPEEERGAGEGGDAPATPASGEDEQIEMPAGEGAEEAGEGEADGEVSDDEAPDGETPDGETPDGETLDGETPDDEMPDDETPDDETPNEASTGDYPRELIERSLQRALRAVVEAALQSPHFLYRIERGLVDAAQPERRRLDGFELASRLSFLIWRSTPDARLLELAASGALEDEETLASEARRMAEEQRGRSGLWSFFEQWLGLRKLKTLERDRVLYPSYDPELRTLWSLEIQLLIEELLFEVRDLRRLFDSPRLFVDERLARLYDVAAPAPGEIALREGDPVRRSGLMTRGAILALTAKANMTDPVHRGLYVRERLLCAPLPPPPPDVVAEAPDPDPRLTTRQRFSQHRADPACAGCHQLVDPIGFGLENYDPVGRWRERENGLPIDASGEIIQTLDLDGPFEGSQPLAERLAESEQVQRCVVLQFWRYGLGRGEREADRCHLDELYRRYRGEGFDFLSLLDGLVRSDAFRYRRTPTP